MHPRSNMDEFLMNRMQDGLGHAPSKAVQSNARLCGYACLCQLDDVSLLSPVHEEVLYGIAERAVLRQPAELTLEVRETQDFLSLVDWSALGVAYERGYRGAHAGDGADAAGISSM
jgi:hypothetical protein